jgi:ribosomal-protein-alanine N-acetyltransferase
MLLLLKESGYKKVSLSVQKENYAAKMYLNLGFHIAVENDTDYIMVYNFD